MRRSNLHKNKEGWKRYRDKAVTRAFLNRTDARIRHGITQKVKEDA